MNEEKCKAFGKQAEQEHIHMYEMLGRPKKAFALEKEQ
jgi:hypothetical protein